MQVDREYHDGKKFWEQGQAIKAINDIDIHSSYITQRYLHLMVNGERKDSSNSLTHSASVHAADP